MARPHEVCRSEKQQLCLAFRWPRLNDLLRGKIDKFSIDSLVNMPGRAGLRVELRVKKAAAGIRPFPKRGNAVVTNELINRLREGDAY